MTERILIIDDDELVRTGLCVNLEKAGFEVLAAASGKEAIEVLHRETFALAVCDLMLGDMDGVEVLRAFQETNPDISVVMLTGHGSVGSALEALRGGASDYLQKPVDPNEVVHRIRMVLDTAKMRQNLREERRRNEQRKREVDAQLTRSERMASLGLLAEGAASDLSDVLDPVLALPDQIAALLEAGHPALEKIARIEEALARSRAILHDLAMMGRGGTFKKKPLQVNELIDDFMATTEYRRIAASHGKIRMEVELDASLPPVAGAESHLIQAISNLYVFACEAMPTGGVVKIETTSQNLRQPVGRYGQAPPGDYAIIRLWYSGSPIESEDADRLFEPFYVRDVMGRHYVSGIGMSLVFRVIEDHGGFMDLQVSPGNGNQFLLYLPVISGDVGESLELTPDYTGQEVILVVDDSVEQRADAEAILSSLGYQVLTASSGQEAVALFADGPGAAGDRPIDLLVLDLVLGDSFDGVDTYKKILERCPGPKAVLASGFADIGRIVEAKKLGITRTFQKPYELETLGHAVRQALDDGS